MTTWRPFVLATAYAFVLGISIAYLSLATASWIFYVAAVLSTACIAYGFESVLRHVLD